MKWWKNFKLDSRKRRATKTLSAIGTIVNIEGSSDFTDKGIVGSNATKVTENML